MGAMVNGGLVWGLRAVTTLHALAVFAQAVLAGAFVSGDVALVAWHDANSTWLIGPLSIGQLVLAIVLWQPGGGARWPTLAAVLLLGAEQLERTFGYSRDLAVHIPLGTLVVGLALTAAIAGWLPSLRNRVTAEDTDDARDAGEAA
jgi:hypothetical protein